MKETLVRLLPSTLLAGLAIVAPASAASAAPVQAAVQSHAARPHAATCVTGKGHTVGWIECTGNGEARIVIDCKAPQIPDYYGPWTPFQGYVRLRGECMYGINAVYAELR